MKKFLLLSFSLFFLGCAALFGWDIHAPGMLSTRFYDQVKNEPLRVGLYLPESFLTFTSKDKGGRTADPQTYHVGEAMTPMILEAFSYAFEEFIFLEVEPTPEILKRYGIQYLAIVDEKSFGNDVDFKGQKLISKTQTLVLNSNMQEVLRFESSGSSDAKGVFAKKGGPEVNLNAALENNIQSLVQYLQDWIRSQ